MQAPSELAWILAVPSSHIMLGVCDQNWKAEIQATSTTLGLGRGDQTMGLKPYLPAQLKYH